LLTAISAPATALLLRKEVAALAGVSQAELEALYQVNPVARAPRPGLQRTSRAPTASVQQRMLQCLLANPELGKQIPDTWRAEGAEAEAVEALLVILREADFVASSALLTQLFQGTGHEKLLTAAQTEMMSWGDAFNVEGEFAGLLSKFATTSRSHQFQDLQASLQAKLAQGGLANLSATERVQYLELLKRTQ
jgi:DNA primase